MLETNKYKAKKNIRNNHNLTLVQAAYGFRGMGGGGHIVPADLYMRYRGPNKCFLDFLKFYLVHDICKGGIQAQK